MRQHTPTVPANTKEVFVHTVTDRRTGRVIPGDLHRFSPAAPETAPGLLSLLKEHSLGPGHEPDRLMPALHREHSRIYACADCNLRVRTLSRDPGATAHAIAVIYAPSGDLLVEALYLREPDGSWTPVSAAAFYGGSGEIHPDPGPGTRHRVPGHNNNAAHVQP